jgi:hypothetical protein
MDQSVMATYNTNIALQLKAAAKEKAAAEKAPGAVAAAQPPISTVPGAAAPPKVPLPTASGAAAPPKAPLPTASGAAAPPKAHLPTASGAAAGAAVQPQTEELTKEIYEEKLGLLRLMEIKLGQYLSDSAKERAPYKLNHMQFSEFLPKYRDFKILLNESFKEDTKRKDGKQTTTNANGRQYANPVETAMISLLFGIKYDLVINITRIIDLYYMLFTFVTNKHITEDMIEKHVQNTIGLAFTKKECLDCAKDKMTCRQCYIDESEWYNKYLKYKQKYLYLKNKIKQN